MQITLYLKHTYDLKTGKTMYQLFAEKNFIAEAQKNIIKVNDARVKELEKRKELELEYNSVDLGGELAKQLELNNPGGKAFEGFASAKISDRKARQRGRENKKMYLFSSKASHAETLVLQRMVGKGKVGEQQVEWWNTNFFKPFSRANNALASYEVTLNRDLKTIFKSNKNIKRDLNKLNETGYTNSESLRIYLWSRQGENIPGLSKTDQAAIVKHVQKNPEMVKFANSLSLATKGYGWGKPTNNWSRTDLQGDVVNILNSSVRPELFKQWTNNTNTIFSQRKHE